MDGYIRGLLRVRVIRGVNLAVRDVRSSDPYVVVRMGKQRVKTRVMRHNDNPEWNEEMTLTISGVIHPIRIEVFDQDTFTRDDSMGFVELHLHSFMEFVKAHVNNHAGEDLIVHKILPNQHNSLVQESCIQMVDGKITQDLCLRLREVECGEVELQLEWINVNNSELHF